LIVTIDISLVFVNLISQVFVYRDLYSFVMKALPNGMFTLAEFERAVKMLPPASEYYVGQIHLVPLTRVIEPESGSIEPYIPGSNPLNQPEVLGVPFQCVQFGQTRKWVFMGKIIIVGEVYELAASPAE
jgi:hypothetical protein